MSQATFKVLLLSLVSIFKRKLHLQIQPGRYDFERDNVSDDKEENQLRCDPEFAVRCLRRAG